MAIPKAKIISFSSHACLFSSLVCELNKLSFGTIAII